MPSSARARLRDVDVSPSTVRLYAAEPEPVAPPLVTKLHVVQSPGTTVRLYDPTAWDADALGGTSQAIPYVFATASGPINASGTTADTVPVDVGCTATLTAGRWLLVATCSHSNLEGTGGLTESSEIELRHNATRIGVSRWDSAFSFYGYLGTMPNNVGSSLKVLAVVSASGGDTISMWLRRENNGNGDTSAVVAIDGVIKAINLDLFVEGVDYWYAAGPNSDTPEATLSGTSWSTAAAAGRIGQGVGEVPMTAPVGPCWVIASGEGHMTATVATTEVSRARLRRADGTPATIGTGVEHQVHHDGGQPTTFVVDFFEEDVLTFVGGELPELQWELSNGSGGTSVQWRRSRIFVLRAGALADFEFIANAGGIVEPGGTTVEAANALTFDFGTAVPTVISSTATWQSGGSNWGRAWLHQDAGDVHHPPSGRIEAFIPAYELVGTSGDEAPIHLGTIIAQTGSVSWRLADQSDSGANPHTLGRNLANTGDARTVLVAFPLLTAGASISSGVASIALDGATLSSAFDTDSPSFGASVILDGATSTSTAEVVDPAAASITLDGATAAATAEVVDVATSSTTLDGATSSSSAEVVDVGAASITLDGATSTSTAEVVQVAASSTTLDGATSTAIAEAPFAGTASPILDGATAGGAFEVTDPAAASVTLDDATSTATLELPSDALVLSTVLDGATVAATATATSSHDASITLDGATSTSALEVPGGLDASITLAGATAAATLEAPFAADASITLDGATSTSAPLPADYDATITLDGATVVAIAAQLPAGPFRALVSAASATVVALVDNPSAKVVIA